MYTNLLNCEVPHGTQADALAGSAGEAGGKNNGMVRDRPRRARRPRDWDDFVVDDGASSGGEGGAESEESPERAGD
ncbi:hypothetical protein WJX81_006426 [Elliptochloris bilobata]